MQINSKLTKSFVDSLDKEGFYWDKDLRGFGIRISGQTKSYIVQSRINGKDTRRTIGRHGVFTAEEARKRAREILVQMANGIDPKEEARAQREERITLAELFDAYISQRNLALRTENDYSGYMTRYFGDWRNLPITSIKPDMVQERHLTIGENHGEAQADVAMRCLRALFNFAEGIYTRANGDVLIASNPTKRLSAMKQWFRPHQRETYIKEETLHQWYRAANCLGKESPGSNIETVRDYLLFVLFTGLRRTEASLMRWEHVDFIGRRFTLPRTNTKNRTNLVLPLTTFTFALLKQRESQRQSDYVFPGEGRTGHVVEPRYAMRKITEDSGVVFTMHDLRRTFATCAATVVDNDWTIKRLMNHLTGQDITQRYMQGIERLRAPAQRVTDYMISLTQQPPLDS
jgi:integrase